LPFLKLKVINVSKVFGLDSLKGKVKIKKEAKKLPVGDLEKFISVLNEVLSEKKEKIKLETEKKRIKDIAKIKSLLDESGLTPDDLKVAKKSKKAAAVKKKTAKPVPAKYRLIDNGVEYLWSGRGRTPNKFQEYFDAGNSRESCEIAN
jgi:DNA-binding protein H-NS